MDVRGAALVGTGHRLTHRALHGARACRMILAPEICMPEYFYTMDGQQGGPVLFPELQQLVAAGRIRPDDLVWTESMPKWAPAASVPGLFASEPDSTSAPDVDPAR